jgi:hypothetical protein
VSTLEEAFGKLLGRQPSDKERQDLYRTRDALALRDNDALWLLLMALGHYQTLYQGVPERIRETAKETLSQVKEAADAQMRASAAVTERELAQAIARTADRIAKEAARVRMLRWAVVYLAASVGALVLVGWSGYRTGAAAGRARGWDDGYRQTRDERAAASWASGVEGRLALGLAAAGSLRELASCSGRGWVRKEGVCLPRPDRGVVYGWRVAPDGCRDRSER